MPEGMDSFYNSHPGTAEHRKIITENIYDNDVFKKKWSDFTEDISRKTGEKIIGTTTGITSCYSDKEMVIYISKEQLIS